MQYHIRNFITGLLSIAIVTFVSTGLIQAQDYTTNQNPSPEDNVVEVIQNSDEHTIFASLLEEADKVQELKNEESVTVIAPTDEAFEKMDKNVEELKQNPRELENFIENHIKTKDEVNNQWDKNMNRSDQEKTEKEMHNKMSKDKEVIEASNGEVHIVDEVKTDKKKDNYKQ